MKPVAVIITGFLIFTFPTLLARNYKNPQIDSLIQVIETYPDQDTVYLKALISLARKIRMEDFNQSVEYFNQAIDLSKRSSRTLDLVRAYNGVGITYGMSDNFPEAIQHFNLALRLALEHGFSDHAGTSYGSLGIVYKRMGEYPTSLSYYTKSLQLYDSLGDRGAIASTNHNLGVLFDLMKEPEKSKECLLKALDIYEETGSEENIASIKVSLAILHLKEEKYQQAIEQFLKAIEYFDKSNAFYFKCNAQSNIGWAYYKAGDFARAEEHLWEALADARKYKLIQLEGAILYSLSKTKASKGQFRESFQLAEKAKTIADSLNVIKKKADVEELLADVYERYGDYPKALEHFKNYSALKDSLFDESKVRSFKNQQVMQEVYEKDKQLESQTLQMAFLNQEIDLENRWKWTLGFASFFLLVAGSLYYQKYQQGKGYSKILESKNELITRQKKQIEEINLQLEKRMLRAQMNPHFIFNSLSSIQHFITVNDKISALHYLSHFSNMLRQILETSVNVNMVLKDEIELIKIYLELEALRFEDSFSYEVKVDPKLDIQLIEIPTMIIQPFVENAILHGLMPKKTDRKLEINISEKGSFIFCGIRDNGIGRKAAELLNHKKTGKSKSRGISVTRQRLDLLANNHDLITDIVYIDLVDESGEPGGTLVEIKIPKQEI